MKYEKIRRLLISKGYYSYDHAISKRVIKDIVNAFKKTEISKKPKSVK